MYEPVPMLSRFLSDSKSHIIACPRCGWTLQQTQSGEYTCYSDICGKVYDLRFPKIEWHRQTNDLSLRAKPGIQRFIVSPEQELLILRNQLENMGFQTELWTGVDEFDLYVQFADGVAWAIDVKDYSSPKHLADNLKSGSITPVKHWNKAFYVIPEHRRNATYLRITNRLWNNSDQRIEIIYINDFVDKVQRNIH